MSVSYKSRIRQYHDRRAKVLDGYSIIDEVLCAGSSVAHQEDDCINTLSPGFEFFFVF